uniref:Uncharacterized protein n=1 Tax=Chrysolophus pictus TaxID=9089 RepID=A0A8C3KWA2_CHRPC
MEATYINIILLFLSLFFFFFPPKLKIFSICMLPCVLFCLNAGLAQRCSSLLLSFFLSQGWRCKRYGHRTGDKECPFFIKGNQKLEQFRVAHEDPMYDIIRETKRHEKEMRIQQLKQLLEDSTSDDDSSDDSDEDDDEDSSSSTSSDKHKKKKRKKEKKKKEKKKKKKRKHK